ncbi:MAG TPA: hypothetical protein VFN25_07770 [Dokdonella sp.]|uniref:hypothetical protein n=1 Tax=Dokdonella sp. TaxID=2291710 RepID=UPI002D7F5BE7|nr:hypothetical protein [Dokdonella sp.]HET9032786.1 hypothetical protein [Dokdonella sp.]
MHTVIVILTGLLLLGIFCTAGRWRRKSLSKAALAFIPLWAVGAGINMWVGVSQAGYSVSEELPMFCLVFGIPALIAAFLVWKFR